MDPDLLVKFVPVLFMKTKEVKRLKKIKTDNKLKRCGTAAATKLHSCDLCHYKTPFISDIRRHRLTHTGENPFQCPICPYKTTTKQNLAHHHLTHTGVKPFECTLCSYKATQKVHMTNHRLTHTGVKPFSCRQCDYSSTTRSNLNRHVKNKHPEQ